MTALPFPVRDADALSGGGEFGDLPDWDLSDLYAAPDAPELANGYFVEPTIVRAKQGDTVTCEEVFGPFVSVSTFSAVDLSIDHCPRDSRRHTK